MSTLLDLVLPLDFCRLCGHIISKIDKKKMHIMISFFTNFADLSLSLNLANLGLLGFIFLQSPTCQLGKIILQLQLAKLSTVMHSCNSGNQYVIGNSVKCQTTVQKASNSEDMFLPPRGFHCLYLLIWFRSDFRSRI